MARLIAVTPNLTRGYSDEFDRQVRNTFEGMAFFSGTGPFGATCGQCIFWSYYRQHRDRAGNSTKTMFRKGCAKYHALTGKHGAIVPAGAAACKYFERREGSK